MATAQTAKSRTTRKSPPITTAPRSKTTAVSAAKASKPKQSAKPAIAGDVWREMVATAAYYRAQARGFQDGSPEQDWLAAEADLKQRLGEIAQS